MPFQKEFQTNYGNLQSYKFFTRPASQHFLGIKNKGGKIKRKKIESILWILGMNGASSTWEMAKHEILNDTSKLRSREKEFRRQIIGRKTTKKSYPGLIDIGLVVKDSITYNKGKVSKYRLSLHGILFCIDSLDLSNEEIDKLAEKYSEILPMLFGNWNFLKNQIKDKVYRIKMLSRGTFLEGSQKKDSQNLLFAHLMTYVHLKFYEKYDGILEEELSMQISYWFYTSLLYFENKKEPPLKKIFSNNKELKKWYTEFIKEVKIYFKEVTNSINEFKI